jgi:DNA-binding MarR family transcriptional regulator
MTPGALAIRERVRPPSMTRVIASLADEGLVEREPHPVDGRQVVVSVSESGAELVKAARRARQEWLAERLATLDDDRREVLRQAADIILALVDESP